MITAENLIKKFDTNFAVDDVSFEINKGEIVGFLGPNGAGKTTTMRILTGFLPADSGNAIINGFSILEDPLAVKKIIGYLPESAPLYSDFMVEEYLQYIGKARGIPDEMLKAKVAAIATKVGLDSVMKKNIEELSKGYRQRVGLAQTLIHDPEVLILDEPTSGLDPIQIQEIRSLIKEIGKEKTIILSTHIMQEVEAAQSQGNASITFSVRGEREKIENFLKNWSEIISLNCLGENQGLFRYRLESKEKIAEKIFHFAVENGFVLTELTQKEASLEDLFLEIAK
jgi:ABC-2 type transport system ATP-binding protein